MDVFVFPLTNITLGQENFKEKLGENKNSSYYLMMTRQEVQIFRWILIVSLKTNHS